MTGPRVPAASCARLPACATSGGPKSVAPSEECTMSITDATAAAEAKGQSKDAATRFAKDQLKAIVERIEQLEEEKKAIADDIKDVYAEAKGNGYDVKALRK